MNVISTEFEGLYVLEPAVFGDDRGFFMESYSKQLLARHNIFYNFVQDNHSKSKYGVVRGLHFQQAPNAQTKLIRTLAGKILDVVVDIRKESKTFGQVFSIELSAKNKKQLLIPKGFAHGFSTLSESVEILYKCDNYYHPECEGGIAYNDPALNIDWKIAEKDILVSEKDGEYPTLKNAEYKF